MSDGDIKNDNPERSAAQLLQEINSGLVDPKLLDSATRQRCIEVLVGEGYAISHIAQVLKRNERTIRRDLKEIHAQHALTPSAEFTKEFIGQVLQKALNHHAYLMRIARAKDSTPGEKMQAEFAAWKVLKEFVERLQNLGYLPQKTTKVSGGICLGSEKQTGEPIEEAPSICEADKEITSVCSLMGPMERERLSEKLRWVMTGSPNAAKLKDFMSEEPGEMTKWLLSPD